jgi:hypothetical protein
MGLGQGNHSLAHPGKDQTMNKTHATLFVEVADKGLLYDHHESDLYIRHTPENVQMVESHGLAYTTFTNSDGGVWLDIPFAYDPFFWKVTA